MRNEIMKHSVVILFCLCVAVVTGDLKQNIVCRSLRNKTFKIFQLLEQQSKSVESNYSNFSKLTEREISLENYTSTRVKHSKASSLYSERAALAFGVLFIIFMVYLISRFCECNNRDSLTTYNRQESLYENSNSFHHYISSPRAPTIFDNLNMDVPQNTGYRTTQLDLPPTYAASTHNSNENLHEATNRLNKNNLNAAESGDCSLPPSYDEAVSHKDDHNNDTARQS